MITWDVSSPALARLPLRKVSLRQKRFGSVFYWNRKGLFSYLFHVSVVHGVVWHFIHLQFNNFFELIAIAFPLADNDHFIKQEYIPERIDTQIHCSFWRWENDTFVIFLQSWYSPVLFCSVDDGTNLQLSIYLWSPVFLQFHLLLRSHRHTESKSTVVLHFYI